MSGMRCARAAGQGSVGAKDGRHAGRTVVAHRAQIEGKLRVARMGESSDLLKCSFCGKSQKQVKKLIAGPGVYICDE